MFADPKNVRFPEDRRKKPNKYKTNIPHLDFPLYNHRYKPEYNYNSVIPQVLKEKINAIFSSGYKNKSKLWFGAGVNA